MTYKLYWQIITMCKDGLMHKQIASMLTGVSLNRINADCESSIRNRYITKGGTPSVIWRDHILELSKLNFSVKSISEKLEIKPCHIYYLLANKEKSKRSQSD